MKRGEIVRTISLVLRVLAILWLIGGSTAAVIRLHRYSNPMVLAGVLAAVAALAGGLWAISFFIRLAGEDEEE